MTANAVCQTEAPVEEMTPHSHHFDKAALGLHRKPLASLASRLWVDRKRHLYSNLPLFSSKSLQRIRQAKHNSQAALRRQPSVRKPPRIQLARNQSLVKPKPQRLVIRTPMRQDMRIHIDPALISKMALQCFKLNAPVKL